MLRLLAALAMSGMVAAIAFAAAAGLNGDAGDVAAGDFDVGSCQDSAQPLAVRFHKTPVDGTLKIDQVFIRNISPACADGAHQIEVAGWSDLDSAPLASQMAPIPASSTSMTMSFASPYSASAFSRFSVAIESSTD